MKWMKILTVICFCAIMLVPVLSFNFEENVVSEIDNRMLAANPFTVEGDLSTNIQNYISDRIGFRDEMILGYTVLNDRIFGKMAHPSYSYGEDGYVFSAGLEYVEYGEFHEAFADMMGKLQDYCDARDIPFLMVFEPAKTAVLTEYLPKGMYYDRSWVEQFFKALEERGVRYLDNTVTLREKHQAGEVVFNQKYDANHWNDLGAYYGVTRIAEILQQDIPTVHVTTMDELTVSQKLETSLPVSKFPIEEYVPEITLQTECQNRTGEFSSEIQINKRYRTFGYFVNTALREQGAPRALVFQGSYMNGKGVPFLKNTFGEYIYVHDYQNVLNFDYYFNVFQPECVVFEVAEYTLINTYFNLEGMKNMVLNPPLEAVAGQVNTLEQSNISKSQLTVKERTALTTVIWNTDTEYRHVWLSETKEFDFYKFDGGYAITLDNSTYQSLKDTFCITALSTDGETLYQFTVE